MEQEKLAINAAILEINKRKKAAAVLQTNRILLTPSVN